MGSGSRNEHFVALLLGAGADPNLVDRQWTGGVSYAAERDHIACVRLMLEAGAEPDPVLPDDIKVGSALNCAARNASQPLVMKTLFDFGVDVESSGVECITSLIHAARTNKASFAMVLLEYGADINATSSLGQTPLTTAIAYNSHDVLQLLLDRWFEHSECPRLKSQGASPSRDSGHVSKCQDHQYVEEYQPFHVEVRPKLRRRRFCDTFARALGCD